MHNPDFLQHPTANVHLLKALIAKKTLSNLGDHPLCQLDMATQHGASANYAGDRGPDILGAIISTYCISIVVIGLRTISRRISKAGFWIDDWLIYASTVILIAIVRTGTLY